MSTAEKVHIRKAVMSEYRKYSVHEIDALRTVVKQKYIFGTYRTSRIGMSSMQYKEDVMVRIVEEMVRTPPHGHDHGLEKREPSRDVGKIPFDRAGIRNPAKPLAETVRRHPGQKRANPRWSDDVDVLRPDLERLHGHLPAGRRRVQLPRPRH